jgi:hypothetical protein
MNWSLVFAVGVVASCAAVADAADVEAVADDVCGSGVPVRHSQVAG